MLKQLIAATALSTIASTAWATCPSSVAGKYVVYGSWDSPVHSSSSAGLLTLGPLSSTGVGSVSGTLYYDDYPYVSQSGVAVSGMAGGVQSVAGQYTYDKNCFGYVWFPNQGDSSKADLKFFFVSDGGAQIVMTFGPRGVTAGNPPAYKSGWTTTDPDHGVTVFRKQ